MFDFLAVVLFDFLVPSSCRFLLFRGQSRWVVMTCEVLPHLHIVRFLRFCLGSAVLSLELFGSAAASLRSLRNCCMSIRACICGMIRFLTWLSQQYPQRTTRFESGAQSSWSCGKQDLKDSFSPQSAHTKFSVPHSAFLSLVLSEMTKASNHDPLLFSRLFLVCGKSA